MDEQGRSTFSEDQNGRILDRLAGLEKVISQEQITNALKAADKQSVRRCKLTHEIMILVVLAMGLFTELPIRQVFKACRKIRKGEASPCRSALCMARQRLGSEPLVALYKSVVKPMATEQTPGAFYKGMRKVAIDGTVMDVADCDAHRHLGRSSGSKGEGPFPQLRKVSLVELGTHIEFAFVYGGWKDSERKLVKHLWDSIPADGLLMDADEFPAMELIMEYHESWEEEMVYDEQKTRQDPCRAEKTTHLRSETSDGLKQELYILSLGHFVTRVLMLEAAKSVDLDTDRLSFKGCFQILKTRLPECDPRTETSFCDWLDAVVWEMSCEKIPARRNRINPRVIKRKMSRWNKCRPEHRKLKPLTKTFVQTVVMNN